MVFKRSNSTQKKKKEVCPPSPPLLLEESPKRVKVQAQRKFAAGSNINSPVITPIRDLECHDLPRTSLPEPVELLPMKRPNTEDFLTFLCFRGTPILPPNLNFFNTASIVDTNGQVHEIKSESSAKNGPIDVAKCGTSSEKPFIAFGVRKRADPVVISRQMERKRRHALALQALRRKYQEQKMAKIRAFTISKLSEKSTNKTLVKTNTISKTETLTKKNNSTLQKTKVVATKHIKVTTQTLKTSLQSKVRPKMCLRSFRGRFVQKELPLFKKRVTITKKNLQEERRVIKKKELPQTKTKEKVKPQPEIKKKDETSVKNTQPFERITRSGLVKRVLSKNVIRQNIKKRILLTTPSTALVKPKLRSTTLKKSMASQREARIKNRAQIREKLLARRATENNSNKAENGPPKEHKREATKNVEVTKEISKVVDKTGKESVRNVNIRKKESSTLKDTKETDKTIDLKKEIRNVEVVLSKCTELKSTGDTVEKTKKEVNKSLDSVKKTIPKKKAPQTNSKKSKPEEKISSKKQPTEVKKKVETVVTRGNQRPTRKTKEAAAIYMEILSHKLVSDGKADEDTVSIDSFPELPNVKRTEQRENELKAKVKSTTADADQDNFKQEILKSKVEETDSDDEALNTKILRNSAQKQKDTKEAKDIKEVKVVANKNIKEDKNKKKENLEESEESLSNTKLRGTTRSKNKIKTTKVPSRASSEESSRSSGSNINLKKLQTIEINKKSNKRRNFSESDEEPLSKLTKSVKSLDSSALVDNSKSATKSGQAKKEIKPKRECAKRPQNYLPMFSSSDEEDELFRGYSEKSAEVVPPACPPSLNLLRGEQGRKAKVNMSNEQIEKWLKESALAGNSIRKENDEMLKFGERIPAETGGRTSVDRRPIFRKDRNSVPTPVVNKDAFSPENERSVYAFGEEEDLGSGAGTPAPPFRRPPSRRPSSTATSRSEESGQFRRPAPSPAVTPPACVEAPVFRPTEREFQHPLAYIESIRARAEPFGLCRVVPPAGFRPECRVSDEMRFTAHNQYVHKMMNRWGPSCRELAAIRRYLATQSIALTQMPLIGGMEVDLPRLYRVVQQTGGLKAVIEKKRWGRVAEAMRIPRSAQDRLAKLDDIYCKYLLPYDTLAPAERQRLLDEAEAEWRERAERRRRRDEDAVAAAEDSDSESEHECVVKGRSMALNAFYRVARNTMAMYFGGEGSGAAATQQQQPQPSAAEVEALFWRLVSRRDRHVCVHSGSICCLASGAGFATARGSPFGRHPWNLKVLGEGGGSGSVLRHLGPTTGVTVPTLHVAMVLSACCWYRDPHGLPWTEYLHAGGQKVWYGVAKQAAGRFRAALARLAPHCCRRQPLWLPSDTCMVPPGELAARGVQVARAVQSPGEFVVVFGGAFASSLATGYAVSESVCFAPPAWLREAPGLFAQLRAAREPPAFALDRLLVGLARAATAADTAALSLTLPLLEAMRDRELAGRAALRRAGGTRLREEDVPEAAAVAAAGGARRRPAGAPSDAERECDVCRAALYASALVDEATDAAYCLEHGRAALDAAPASARFRLRRALSDDHLRRLVDDLAAALRHHQPRN